MNNFFYHLIHSEKEYWKQLAFSYQSRIRELEEKVELMKSEQNGELQSEIINDTSGKISIQNVKVNQIQSGAAFNIAEMIYSTTKSDMDMDLGPNSMNIGDHNRMEHQEGYRVKLGPVQEV
ncbi:hypothetical protein [Mesobacillus jeotgali]|uniref:hypothetical protein n=1 Tax=Mesobacillus jeotgali TaxID=129985 RepID=UPI000C829A41|nr:hypothetical protein [Mesobacillus jeotgali]